MQQVVVPQFLDVEDKILGPITVRQFLELLVGVIILAILYRLLYFVTFVFVGFVVVVVTLVLAFLRVNGQAFHLFLLNFIQTLKSPKLKIWRKQYQARDYRDTDKPEAVKSIAMKRPVSVSRISEIALVIDTGGIYRGENGN